MYVNPKGIYSEIKLRMLDLSMVEFFSYIQPVSGKGSESTLEEIVNMLRSRSVNEQKRVLKVISAMLDDPLD